MKRQIFAWHRIITLSITRITNIPDVMFIPYRLYFSSYRFPWIIAPLPIYMYIYRYVYYDIQCGAVMLRSIFSKIFLKDTQDPACEWDSTSTPVIIYVKSSNIASRYNGTRLYNGEITFFMVRRNMFEIFNLLKHIVLQYIRAFTST